MDGDDLGSREGYACVEAPLAPDERAASRTAGGWRLCGRVRVPVPTPGDRARSGARDVCCRGRHYAVSLDELAGRVRAYTAQRPDASDDRPEYRGLAQAATAPGPDRERHVDIGDSHHPSAATAGSGAAAAGRDRTAAAHAGRPPARRRLALAGGSSAGCRRAADWPAAKYAAPGPAAGRPERSAGPRYGLGHPARLWDGCRADAAGVSAAPALDRRFAAAAAPR